MDTTKNSELKDIFPKEEKIYLVSGDKKIYILILLCIGILIPIGLWLLSADAESLILLSIIFAVPCVCGAVYFLFSARRTFFTNTTLTCNYTFFPSKNYNRDLTGCVGYFSYFQFTQMKNSTIKKFGVILKFNDGKIIPFVANAGAGESRNSLDALIVRLRSIRVPQVVPNLGKQAQVWRDGDFAYPFIVGAMNVEKIAQKTFVNSAYNPTFII